MCFSPDGGKIATGSKDGTLRIWNSATGKEYGAFVPLVDLAPVFVTPDNRFDTEDIENAGYMHWVVSDDPFTPLPLDIFMRLYYEPNLYARVMKGEKLPEIPSIAKLNRVQPKVEILSAAQTSSDSISVTIQVSPASREYGDPKVLHTTGAKDLRVFRDKRLVKMVSGPLVSWGDAPKTYTFEIPVPKEGKKSVEISAYALNDSGVKSQTPSVSVNVEEQLVKPKAYVLAIGVNDCEDKDLHLSYAADDARAMATQVVAALSPPPALHDALPQADESGGQYLEVIPTTLVSNEGNFGATTETVHKAIENLKAKARPEDLVLISWSGHGFVAKDHKLHLILSNTGSKLNPDAEVLPGTVGTDELADWLQDLDARSALILDACHSKVSVSAGGFKAGPMGDRGLGQLSYDKGMMVLAASQDAGVAVETEVKGVGRGLLTYALVDRGLSGAKSLRAWLSGAAELVPSLYRDLKSGKLKGRGVEDMSASTSDPYIQTPQLFDFAKNWDATLRP